MATPVVVDTTPPKAGDRIEPYSFYRTQCLLGLDNGGIQSGEIDANPPFTEAHGTASRGNLTGAQGDCTTQSPDGLHEAGSRLLLPI
jgi:hypothetical protein